MFKLACYLTLSRVDFILPLRGRDCKQIVRTELWETITRQGILGNIFMGLLVVTKLN